MTSKALRIVLACAVLYGAYRFIKFSDPAGQTVVPASERLPDPPRHTAEPPKPPPVEPVPKERFRSRYEYPFAPPPGSPFNFRPAGMNPEPPR